MKIFGKSFLEVFKFEKLGKIFGSKFAHCRLSCLNRRNGSIFCRCSNLHISVISVASGTITGTGTFQLFFKY